MDGRSTYTDFSTPYFVQAQAGLSQSDNAHTPLPPFRTLHVPTSLGPVSLSLFAALAISLARTGGALFPIVGTGPRVGSALPPCKSLGDRPVAASTCRAFRCWLQQTPPARSAQLSPTNVRKRYGLGTYVLRTRRLPPPKTLPPPGFLSTISPLPVFYFCFSLFPSFLFCLDRLQACAGHRSVRPCPQ